MTHFYYEGEGIVWLEEKTLLSTDIDYFISLLNYIYYE